MEVEACADADDGDIACARQRVNHGFGWSLDLVVNAHVFCGVLWAADLDDVLAHADGRTVGDFLDPIFHVAAPIGPDAADDVYTVGRADVNVDAAEACADGELNESLDLVVAFEGGLSGEDRGDGQGDK